MKKYYIIAMCLMLLYSCTAGKQNQSQSEETYRRVKSLIDNKDFFSARDIVKTGTTQIDPYHKLVVNATLDNAFNRPWESNNKIDAILTAHSAMLTDPVKLELLKLKQANHGRLFEYDKAAMVTDEIVNGYSGILSQKDIDDYNNTGKIWHALKEQPKQHVIIDDRTIIKMQRDKAGLANLEVSADNVSTGFIFDTGANISTVTRSTAQRFNMIILDADIEVGSITGAKVNSALAVCPDMKIGHISVKNAVFLVFEDKDLAFPQIDYQINGILGFPVIEAMKEIQITVNEEFIVPEKQTAHTHQNMALDFLNPVIQLGNEYYTFDTGATGTFLYSKYYEKHRAYISQNYKPEQLEFGGAGGMKTVTGYNVVFRPVVNDKEIIVEQVQLYTETIGEKDSLYYGNIGQDVIKQFDKMTINFESMFIKFD